MKKKTINIILGSLLTGSMVAGVVDTIAETKTEGTRPAKTLIDDFIEDS